MTFADEARSSPIKFFYPVPSAQPAAAVGVIGGQAVFTCAFTSTNPAVVSFQWQIQTDGSTWGNLVETAGYYEGVATTTLTVKAIDNFLATRTSCNFRCRALFANAVPSFTNAAALSIPIHTDWNRFLTACGHATSGPVVSPAATTPVVTGFAGPFTYSWVYLDGDAAISCSSAVAAAPTFSGAYVAFGISYTRWICTISNGGNSVASDPLLIVIAGDTPGGSVSLSTTFPDESSFLIFWNGARPDNYFSGFGFVYSGVVRGLIAPTIGFTTTTIQPNDKELGTVNGTPDPGTAVVGIYSAAIRNPPAVITSHYLGAFNNANGGPGLAATLYG